MQTYVVEHYLTGWERDDVVGLLARLDNLAPSFASSGVTYMHSIVLDADETCFCVFRGPDAERIRHAHLEHGLPTDRIVAATFAAVEQGPSA